MRDGDRQRLHSASDYRPNDRTLRVQQNEFEHEFEFYERRKKTNLTSLVGANPGGYMLTLTLTQVLMLDNTTSS